MNNKRVLLTQKGSERLTLELKQLKSVDRPAVIAAIAEARAQGDLSENAEYDAAKEAQGMLELRINDLEKQLANARVMEISDVDISKVTVLSKVTIKNKANNATITYQIVSESESDLKAKRISISSPMGKGLLGKKIGDVAHVETPNGKLEFVIENISI